VALDPRTCKLISKMKRYLFYFVFVVSASFARYQNLEIIHCDLLILILIFPFSGEDYVIKTTWDNQTIDHIDRPVVISLDRFDSDAFKITVNGPFYQGKGPNGYVGEPLYGLWDYEGTSASLNL